MFNTQTTKLRINFNLKDISRVGGSRSQIWLSTTINGERVRVYTRQLINPEHWIKSDRHDIGGGMAREDNSLGRVANKENKAINKALKQILTYCDDYLKLVTAENLQTSGVNKVDMSPITFKEYVESRIAGNDYLRKYNAENFIKDYIDNKRKEVNPTTGKRLSSGTIYNHRNAFNRLRQYADSKRLKITWNLFNRDLERGFTAWMTDKGFTPGTIATQYSVIKVWLTEAERRNLIDDKAFHNYRTSVPEVDNIYLTEGEIQRLYDLDLSDMKPNDQSQIEETRDLFIVGCWTGLRYSDYGSLPTIEGDNMIVNVHTRKTNKTVTIPLHPLVKSIYEKYGGCLPKPIDRGKAMKNIRKCAKAAGITNHVTIHKIQGGKSISLTKPKYEFIMNHSARRSFATNMYLKGAPTISIMAITGHTTETNFMRYIKISAEEHAKIIANIF